MNRYMENRLTDLHMASLKQKLSGKLIIFITSFVATIIIPFIHLGVFYNFWAENKPPVDKSRCTCSCFDTIFRGKYEWPPSMYKHIYFNSTVVTFKIWIIVCLGIILCYETAKKLLTLLRFDCARLPMFGLFLSSLYPHYYGWWNFFQYLNEEFYDQWYHQLYFTITEILSTLMVIHLCDTRNQIKPWKLLFIFNLNSLHIIVSSLDQFIKNVLHGGGQDFEILRDVGLMFPDLLHVLVAYFEMSILAEKSDVAVHKLFHREEIFLSILVIILFAVLGKAL